MNIIHIKKLVLGVILGVLAVCAGAGAQDGDRSGGLTIKDKLEQVLPPQLGRKIVFEPMRNMLTVTDTEANHRKIKELINLLDVGPKQVVIEAKFVELGMMGINELGVEWSFLRPGTVSDFSDDFGIQGDIRQTDFPVNPEGINFFVSSTAIDGRYARAYLHMLEEQDAMKILSSPRVTTTSGESAIIQITETLPYITDVTLENIGTAEHPIWSFDYSVSEESIGIILEVVPRVGEYSKLITLDLHPQIDILKGRVAVHSSVDAAMGWPVVDSRDVQTSVIIRSGYTIVLGGFIKDNDKTTLKKVPFLGDIPFLGKMFSHEYTARTKNNLLIFITATLITPSGEEIR